MSEINNAFTGFTAPNMGIETLTGANYSAWKDLLMLTLGITEFDYALREPAPPALTDKSTAEAKQLYEKWEKANRMALMFIKNSISPIIKGAIPDLANAKTYLSHPQIPTLGVSPRGCDVARITAHGHIERLYMSYTVTQICKIT
ncbi:hypothetical protein E3N88_06022 [Mikania micrantha]|uniref:Retrotransposon Copia-like N-terminal domain-containing protein n=1 Tax=Mikania micrantha TaxID=192012 RepID=A0A5N6PNI0_9ASTR|nr:hypothetical protein E3N88_06022 [Mikania micrantha]